MDISSNKIAFDFDGTLVDVGRRDWCIYQELLREQNFECLEFKPYWEQRRQKTPLDQLLPRGIDLKSYVEKRSKWMERRVFLELDTLFENVNDVLQKLAPKYELWVVSSRSHEIYLIDQMFDMDIYYQFEDRIVITNDKRRVFQTLKPSVVIGDTENDIEPAKSLSIPTIAMTTGIRSAEFLRNLKPDWLLDDIKQVPDVLYA